MPSENAKDRDSQPSRPTLRARWEALAGAARTIGPWAKANRLRAILVVGAGLLSVGGVMLAWSAMVSHRSGGEPVTLEEALTALDSGAYLEASQLAKTIQARGELPMEELGGPVFVLGAAAAYEADDTWSRDKINYYLLASRYLEEARDRGFPAGRRAEGLYLLGRSLYLSGQVPASRPVLLEAWKVNKRRRTEIHGLLADAYLHAANPRLEEALAENEKYLRDAGLPPAARHRGLLQRARILLSLNRIPEFSCTRPAR
jgi:hypothetical protein